jgi:amino-acid N-acetyltransferase
MWPDVTAFLARRARTGDVGGIKALVDRFAGRVLLAKDMVTLYEDVQEFWVVELDGKVVGCGALHVLWQDLAEIRTIAVAPELGGKGVGHALVTALLRTARELGVRRVFVLTFERGFFGRHGFVEIDGTPVAPEVYEQMRRSYDAGVAEFLDQAYVRPNTLGNARMLLNLHPPADQLPRDESAEGEHEPGQLPHGEALAEHQEPGQGGHHRAAQAEQ